MKLSDFRVDGSAPPMPAKEKTSLDFKSGNVMAFDQSISATGWVYLVNGRGGLIVRDCGSIMSKPDGYPKGHQGSLLRVDEIAEQMAGIMRRLPVTQVVHEMPPVAIGRMSRPEASLMTAVAVRLEARRQGHPVAIVSNQHAKKVLVGNGNATKPEWHAVLPTLDITYDKPVTNEGQRDALCLGLTWLIDKEED